MNKENNITVRMEAHFRVHGVDYSGGLEEEVPLHDAHIQGEKVGKWAQEAVKAILKTIKEKKLKYGEHC